MSPDEEPPLPIGKQRAGWFLLGFAAGMFLTVLGGTVFHIL